MVQVFRCIVRHRVGGFKNAFWQYKSYESWARAGQPEVGQQNQTGAAMFASEVVFQESLLSFDSPARFEFHRRTSSHAGRP